MLAHSDEFKLRVMVAWVQSEPVIQGLFGTSVMMRKVSLSGHCARIRCGARFGVSLRNELKLPHRLVRITRAGIERRHGRVLRGTRIRICRQLLHSLFAKRSQVGALPGLLLFVVDR